MGTQLINDENIYLGIEVGSTRIKACLIDGELKAIASGSYEWQNRFEGGYWTYPIEDVRDGVRAAYKSLKDDYFSKYGKKLTRVSAIGVSGMMHGYLPFDKDDNLLVPFRTWRNTTAGKAGAELTELFNFKIPQRWSIAHLYQAMLDGEAHVEKIAHITTVAGYIYYLLTGKWEIGVGDGSGIFPVNGYGYDGEMLSRFENLAKPYGYPWKISEILPTVMPTGNRSSVLTESGAKFLDESGELASGIVVCPPEGDVQTGLVATNSIKPTEGSFSAGTSVFCMLILKEPLRAPHKEIDIQAAPNGYPVAIVHSNNGCSELDLWVNMFSSFASLIGKDMDKSALYEALYNNALSADADCGEVISYNCLAPEPVAGIQNATPLYFRTTGANLTLGNFFRSQINATFAPVKIGVDILASREGVMPTSINAHGGLFKVKGVASQLLADMLRVPVCVASSAGEGGAWGMALLAAYAALGNGEPLEDWLDRCAFSSVEKYTVLPTLDGTKGAEKYFELYTEGIKTKFQ